MSNHAESSRTASARLQLDPSIWQNLSPVFMASILARLPLHSVARFRAVCRYWNVELRSQNFFQAREVIQSRCNVVDWHFIFTFLASNRGGLGLLYDGSHGVWKLARCAAPISWFESSWPNQGMIASGGLVCYNNFVANVLTGSWRWLDCQLPSNQLKLCGFDVDRSTGNFRAFYLGTTMARTEVPFRACNRYERLNVYNSRSRLWSEIELPRPFNNWNPGVVFNNCIYFLLRPRMDDRTLKMMYYNMTANSWVSRDIRTNRSLLLYERLLHQWDGAFYVISTSKSTKLIYVDEIYFESFEYCVMEITYEQHLERLLGIRNSDLRVCNVSAYENVITACVAYTDETTRRPRHQLLGFDFAKKQIGTGLNDRVPMLWRDCMIDRMMVAFEPSLSVTVPRP